MDIQPIEVKTWEGLSHSAFITSAFESLFKTLLVLNPKPNLTEGFLALGVGPGRFTGTRVGVSFAKTLSFAFRIPLYPVSSLKILAESEEKEERPILVLLNAFKNSVYMALYQRKHFKLQELIPPQVVLAQDLYKKLLPAENRCSISSEKSYLLRSKEGKLKTRLFKQEWVCVGDGYFAYKKVLSKELKKRLVIRENIFPEVKYLAQVLQWEFEVSKLISWKDLKPIYLRSPVPLIT